MSVLFPLFFAAAAAVVAPILLHLLRQRARNIQPFSSLMFLRPSPPRMQPRTRVENLPLLLLRCLALILLAIAFARPLWQDLELITAGQKGRTLILLDTSASMSRSGLWDQALKHLDEAIADPEQRVAIVAFDRSLRPLLAFEDWAGQPPAARVELARARARSVTPGSAGTDIGLALAGAADLISDDETAVPEAQGIKRIVLISDLQAGRGLDALRSATWPKGLGLSIRQVSSAQPTNAGLSLVTVAAGLMPEADDKRPRVRVSNDAASKTQAFTVAWSDGVGIPENVSVPPGSTRVVRAPVRPAGKSGSAVVLRGDDHAFDNTLYLTDAAPAEVPVLYLGNDPVDDPTGLSYFLKHALQPTRLLAPRLSINGLGNQAEALSRFNWVVVGGTPSAAMAEQLTAHVTNGGAITVVLRQASDAAWLEKLAGHALRAEEARVNGFAMIGRVDFTHPLLRPFEVARFGDFTKIHVWHHRIVTPPPSASVLAWYDDGQPAWFELSVGKGRVLVLTSGWHPADSQLALSTKFVPLIYTELQRSGKITPRPTQVIIGDASSLPPGTQSVSGPLASADAAAGAATPAVAGNPAPVIAQQGLYRVQTADGVLLVAANVDPLESHTAPLALETLEALGVSISDADAASAAAAAETARTSERRLKTAELEARQKSWLWILAAAFLVLITETIVAGLASRPKAGTPGDAVATEVVAPGAAS